MHLRTWSLLICFLACSIGVYAQEVLNISSQNVMTYTVKVTVGLDQKGHAQFKAEGKGFDGMRIEQISSDPNPEVMSACMAYPSDEKKNDYRMNISLPSDTATDKPVKMRLVDIGRSSVVMTISYTPELGTKEYILSMSMAKGATSQIECPPGCYAAHMVNPKSKTDCEASACCKPGDIHFNFDACEITCLGGSCF